MKKLVCLLLVSLLAFSLLSYSQKQEVTTTALQFVEMLTKGDFSSATEDFDGTMKKLLPPTKLQTIWTSLITQVGPFKNQNGIRMQKYREYDIIFVTCKFERAYIDVKVVFNAEGKISGLFFLPGKPPAYKSPEYVDPNAFVERKVMVGSGKWALDGTLTIPKGNAPFPAVVLVHGSGPNDRDETIGPNKPFRDLAWGLASKGIIVLRYEKRTEEHAAELIPMKDKITVKEETIDDAIAAISLLHHTREVDPEKIFVLGHSLGGMLIPRIGMLDPDITGFIIMAGPTRPLEDLIFEQTKYIFSLDGIISEKEKKQLELLKKQVAMVKSPRLSVSTPSKELPLDIPAAYWLDLRGYEPAKLAERLNRPMLILQGGRDYQVTIKDFQGWKNSLSSLKNVEFRYYPNLNHLFIAGKRKSTPAEYMKIGHVAKCVIDDIANWIKRQ
ncbi:MAG: DUF3887 domain-containing protein [Thermotogae bacterium]|nr:DUF3887 domain-containing protein [Thermotogota bacterium]